MVNVRIVTVKMPKAYVEAIDELVKKGYFMSRSQAIRMAIFQLLKQYGMIKVEDEEEGGEEEW